MMLVAILLSAAALIGCADHTTDVGRPLRSVEAIEGDLASANEPCSGPASVLGMRGCIVDSAGETFDVDGTMHLVAPAPPYGFNYQIEGIALDQQDLVGAGVDTAIKVYAAPYHIEGWPAFPEAHEQSRIRARVALTATGGLLVLIDDALPVGTQVAITIENARLLQHARFLPGGSACPSLEECSQLGYAARFYVGAEPPIVGTPPMVEQHEDGDGSKG